MQNIDTQAYVVAVEPPARRRGASPPADGSGSSRPIPISGRWMAAAFAICGNWTGSGEHGARRAAPARELTPGGDGWRTRQRTGRRGDRPPGAQRDRRRPRPGHRVRRRRQAVRRRGSGRRRRSCGSRRGSFFTFLGPSGCGKTTSLRLIAGFEQPSAGDVRIGGRSMVGVPPHRRPVNMVFQHYALFPASRCGGQHRLRAEAAVAAAPWRRRWHARSMPCSSSCGCPAMARRRIWELSGGQQQRVALARALVNRPTVLLLDEPLAALDRKLRREMQIELQNLQHEVGITFVLVTHDQEEALSMSDTICIMRERPDRAAGLADGALRCAGQRLGRRFRRQVELPGGQGQPP